MVYVSISPITHAHTHPFPVRVFTARDRKVSNPGMLMNQPLCTFRSSLFWIARGALLSPLLWFFVATGSALGDTYRSVPVVAAEAPETEIIADDPESVHVLERSERRFLLYEGMRILDIRIKQLDVFGPTVDDTTYVKRSGIEKILNTLHIMTRDRTIRQNLLFGQGGRVDPYVFADSERILRSLAFIQDARIVIVPDEVVENGVHVLVIVKDLWSLGVSFSLKANNDLKLGLYERNFLGLGHKISNELTLIPDGDLRLGFRSDYFVPNILGSFAAGELIYDRMPDEKTAAIKLNRELEYPEMRYVGGLELNSTRVSIGDSSLFFADNAYTLGDIWAGRSYHERYPADSADRRRTLVLSGRIRRVVFSERPPVTADTQYRYHNRSYYLAGATLSQRRYYRTNLLYNYGRTEDIPYGFLAQLASGMADDRFRRRWYISTTLGAGSSAGALGYGSGVLRFGGYPGDGTVRQGVVQIEGFFFSHLLSLGAFRFRQFFRTGYIGGINRQADETIDFHRKEGIRGVLYDRTVTGTRRLRLNLETVTFTPWRLHGFTFALFTFADLDIIGSNRKSLFSSPVYTGLGFGVRARTEAYGIETIQVRLAWYPDLPVDHRTVSLTGAGEKRVLPFEFRENRPVIVDF